MRPRWPRLTDMRRLLAPVSRSLLAALAFPLPTACSDRRAELAGPVPMLCPTPVRVQVRESGTGAPVEGAQVLFRPVENGIVTGDMILGAISDASGTVLVPAVPPGRYRMVVRRIGFEMTEQVVDLRRSAPDAAALVVSIAAAPGCFLGGRPR